MKVVLLQGYQLKIVKNDMNKCFFILFFLFWQSKMCLMVGSKKYFSDKTFDHFQLEHPVLWSSNMNSIYHVTS